MSRPTSVLCGHAFKLTSLNINLKLTTHIKELKILLAHNEIDILSIYETKLNENCLSSVISFSFSL